MSDRLRWSELVVGLVAVEGLIGRIALTEGISLQWRDPYGFAVAIDPVHQTGRTLLYTIVPQCASCWQAVPFLNALHDSAGCAVRVFGIVVGDRASFTLADSGRTRFPIVFGASGELWEALPLAVPSSTALIGHHGKVEGLWPGSPNGFPSGEVEKLLGPQCRSGAR
jgi:hypothetical protein